MLSVQGISQPKVTYQTMRWGFPKEQSKEYMYRSAGQAFDTLQWRHHKAAFLSHNKNLNAGDFLVDDRTANGAGEFAGEHIHFLSEQFKDWDDVLSYLLLKK